MAEWKMGVIETRFADIIWSNEPLTTAELIKLCEKELNWKRTTTYTVLKKLCGKGLFINNGGTVTSVIKREEYFAAKSEAFVDDVFDGSLPAFLAAFTSKNKLSDKDIEEIRKMIDDAKEGKDD